MGIHINEQDLHDLVLRREPIPNVERLQTCYCRYFKRGEAQAQQSWQAPLSRKNYEHHARIEQQHFLPSDHLLFTDLAPESVSMKIVQAPAEFALPVKQDRRLSPSFKVKVEIKYRGQVSVPLTLKSYIVTQHDKDNILSWHPEDATDQDKKKITELKGTTSITHYFEAGAGGNAKRNVPKPNQGQAGLDVQQSALTGKTVSPAMLLQLWNSEHSSSQDSLSHWQSGNLPIKPIDIGLSSAPLNSLSDSLLGISGSHGLASMAMSEAGPSRQAMLQGLSARDMMGSSLLGGRGPGGDASGSSGELYGMLGLDGWHASQLQQHQLQAQMLQELQQIQHHQQHQQQQQQLQQLQHQLNTMLIPQQASVQQQAAVQQQQQQAVAQLQQQAAVGDLQSIDHEFEFSNLEFVRPTRMNKVYMVFACSLMDMDLVYVVYNVPTVGICRAEQREKACQKLGMTLPPGLMIGEPVQIKQEELQGRKRDAKEHLEEVSASEPGLSEQTFKRPGIQAEAADSDMALSRVPIPEDDEMAVPYSRGALRDWILEQYESTGLTRKLSELDLKALLSQAGFPSDASSDKRVTVSRAQWEEFVQQFRGVLQLLQQIANVWNLQEPCIISGFDMDRVGTIQALSNEPAGTFICRFSMSQPGCLVLTCKTMPGNASSERDNLLHAIIKIDDLHERRVDTWIRDFAGASHVLDVYRQKRVDKRKVFASNYTHLRGLGADFAAPPPTN